MNEAYPGNEQNKTSIEIHQEFAGYVPDEFKQDPFSYFETHGTNIKQGEIQYHTDGSVSEDPTAVKDFPVWQNENNDALYTVAKKVNLEKGMINKTDDPFYEYMVMEYVRSKGLPCPRPIVKVSDGKNGHLIVMERAPGLRWSYRHSLVKQGLTDDEVDGLHKKAEAMMLDLQKEFEQKGIMREWKLSDMVFDIDIANKDIRSLTPVDWERTKISS